MKMFFGLAEKIVLMLQTALFATITAAIGGQILSRKLFNMPLEFPEELSVFLLIASVFIGIWIVEKESSHIKVEFIFQKMSKSSIKIVLISGKILSLIIVITILAGEVQLFPAIAHLKTKASGIPYLWLHILIVVFCVLWVVSILYTIFLLIKNQEN